MSTVIKKLSHAEEYIQQCLLLSLLHAAKRKGFSSIQMKRKITKAIAHAHNHLVFLQNQELERNIPRLVVKNHTLKHWHVFFDLGNTHFTYAQNGFSSEKYQMYRYYMKK